MTIKTEISQGLPKTNPSEKKGSLPPITGLLADGTTLLSLASTLAACGGGGSAVQALPEERQTSTSDLGGVGTVTPTPESTAIATPIEGTPSPVAVTESPPTPTTISTPELQTNLKMAQDRVDELNDQLASLGSPLSIIINTDQAVGKYQLLMIAKTADDTTKTVSLGFLNLADLSLTHQTIGRAVSFMDLRATAIGLIEEPAETDDSSITQGKAWTFDALSMRWEEKAINMLTPCELKELIDLGDYFPIADSTDPETNFNLMVLWRNTDYFQEGTGRFHERGKLSEVHTTTGEVVSGGLARAFLDSYFSVVIEKHNGLITVLDAGGVLSEEPRVDAQTGEKIVDANQFRGHFVQIHVSQVSQVFIAPKLIEVGRHTKPTRDQRRKVELPDGRTLVLDVNYGLPQTPSFGGLFALPDPDSPGKFILVMILNTSRFASILQLPDADVAYALSETSMFNCFLSWAVQSPAKLEASQGLQSILISDKFQLLLTEDDERFFIFNDIVPLFYPKETN